MNATGLMWENAKAFGALLVFAEHRFYGASQPKTATMVNSTTSSSVQDDDSPTSTPVVLQHPYLSHELALADYAVLIETIRRQRGFEFPLMLNLETEEFVGTPPRPNIVSSQAHAVFFSRYHNVYYIIMPFSF